jgi:hypothetical protein
MTYKFKKVTINFEIHVTRIICKLINFNDISNLIKPKIIYLRIIKQSNNLIDKNIQNENS